MNSFEHHPDTETLDRLRAGLFDDDPAHKARLEAHLQQCPACRRAYAWPAAVQQADAIPDSRLDTLRRRALAEPAPRRRRTAPLAAAAALALAVIGLAGLLPVWRDSGPQVAVNDQQVPEIYEDLDFYLWLADHNGSGANDATGDSST